MMGNSIIEIKRLNQDFSVCKVIDYSLVNLNAEYSFIGKTDEEKSLVCLTSDVRQMSLSVMMDGKVFVFKGF